MDQEKMSTNIPEKLEEKRKIQVNDDLLSSLEATQQPDDKDVIRGARNLYKEEQSSVIALGESELFAEEKRKILVNDDLLSSLEATQQPDEEKRKIQVNDDLLSSLEATQQPDKRDKREPSTDDLEKFFFVLKPEILDKIKRFHTYGVAKKWHKSYFPERFDIEDYLYKMVDILKPLVHTAVKLKQYPCVLTINILIKEENSPINNQASKSECQDTEEEPNLSVLYIVLLKKKETDKVDEARHIDSEEINQSGIESFNVHLKPPRNDIEPVTTSSPKKEDSVYVFYEHNKKQTGYRNNGRECKILELYAEDDRVNAAVSTAFPKDKHKIFTTPKIINLKSSGAAQMVKDMEKYNLHHITEVDGQFNTEGTPPFIQERIESVRLTGAEEKIFFWKIHSPGSNT